MVFALGSLFDADQPANSVESREYYLLARLCLRFASPQQNTTLWAIQSLVSLSPAVRTQMCQSLSHTAFKQIYMVQFMEMSDGEPAHSISHAAWILIGYACKLGHSVSMLH